MKFGTKEHSKKQLLDCVDFLYDTKDKWPEKLAPGIITYDIHDVPLINSRTMPGNEVIVFPNGIDLWDYGKPAYFDVTQDEALLWLTAGKVN